MPLRHLEWLLGEPVPDLEMVVHQVLPYAPAQADRIIGQLCWLVGLEVGQAGNDAKRAERAGRRWLHYLRDNRAISRKTIDLALEAPLLQRDADRSDRHDRVVLVQRVSRA